MITLHNKDFTTKYGTINTTIEAFVEEERNGLFELSFIMLNTDSLFNYVKEDNIVVANANDTLLNQKFRIYMTRKLMNNRVEVFARHISFDLMYDYIDSVKFENQSCEYALNMLFRNSQFSTHYRGYSDIINAQDYNMSMANILEAIGGKEGSILDTFGTGAELLRDNENIHVLNKRGHDNSVSIEYKKNLTGFELEEDTTELITRILPYAKYAPTDEEGNSLDEVIVKASFVDSSLIFNYSHPFIKAIDYSDKFDDENIPTVDKLKALAELEYKNNKVDMPKQNFKIEFIPLSKCAGYESLSDNINICDTVTIKDTRYNINTQAKVIKVTFNVLKNRYESMELGEPKTSLGDIVGGNNGEASKGEQGPPGPQGPPGADGNIGDFPDSLPAKSILTGKSVGLASIELTWTFENKVYYSYELYASKTKDFKPNNFDLIYEGQASAFLFQAKPNETWYFRVCAINSHGNRNEFSDQISVSTAKINGNDWIENATIGNALIGDLSADKITSGTISGHYIDARNLSVTDGNGKRTLDIDSFGNVNLNVTSLKISSSNVATENYANNVANTAQTNATNSSKDYTDTKITETKSEIKVTTDSITNRVSSTETKVTNVTNNLNNLQIGGRNYIHYGKGDVKKGFFANFNKVGDGYGEHTLTSQKTYVNVDIGSGFLLGCRDYEVGKQVTFSYEIMYTKWNFPTGTNRSEFWIGQRYTGGTTESSDGVWRGVTQHNLPEVGKDGCELNKWFKVEKVITIPQQAHSSIGTVSSIQLYNSNADVSASVTFRLRNVKIEYGNKATDWTPAPEDMQSQIDTNKTSISTTNSKVSTIETNLNNITSRVSSVETKTTSVDNKVTSQESRLSSAESKITADAIVSTVTSSTTYKNNLSGKVDTNKVVSSINQTAESIKINANKIQLEGATTVGSGGSYISINNYDYRAYVNGQLAINVGGYNDGGTFLPSLYMGANGFNSKSSGSDGQYFVMKNYGTHHHLAQRHQSGTWSTISFDENGNITYSPVSNSVFNSNVNFTKATNYENALNINKGSSIYLNNTSDSTKAKLTYDKLAINKIGAYDTTNLSTDSTIAPTTNNTVSIGTSSYKFKNLYGYNMYTDNIDLRYISSPVSMLYIDQPQWGMLCPNMNEHQYLGAEGSRWRTIYLYMSPNISSDVRKKENIRYVNSKDYTTREDIITQTNMYDFVKGELNIAEYNYLEEKKSTFGFIAQDLEKTKVGGSILTKDSEGFLAYDSGAYVNILAGALKEAINKIEKLENEIEILKANN